MEKKALKALDGILLEYLIIHGFEDFANFRAIAIIYCFICYVEIKF